MSRLAYIRGESALSGAPRDAWAVGGVAYLGAAAGLAEGVSEWKRRSGEAEERIAQTARDRVL